MMIWYMKIPEKIYHRLFDIGVIIKAIDGVLESTGGILLLTVPIRTLSHLVRLLTLHELSRDPSDFFSNLLIGAVYHLTTSVKISASLYLIVHGAVKVWLVVMLLRGKLWAYPAAMVIMGGFVCYQLYRFSHHPGWWLLALSIFDTIVIGLIWHEYQHRKKKHISHAKNA